MNGVQAYFNEHDRHTARWLRNLIEADLLPAGEVDARDIQEVAPDDVRGYRECHFFAGIGGWPLALRLAGWPPARSVWTGSCPCQPFSSAGRQQGESDERHLWPEFLRLIAECRPPTILGEQVASRLGREWLAGVCADLEDLGYAVGAADLCAAGVGAPHKRQRLFWVADAGHQRERAGHGGSVGRMETQERGQSSLDASEGSLAGGLAHTDPDGWRAQGQRGSESGGTQPQRGCNPGGLGHPVGAGRQGCGPGVRGGPVDRPGGGPPGSPGSPRGMGDAWGDGQQIDERRPGPRSEPVIAGPGDPSFWSTFDLVPCRDGKSRRVEPGSFPLAHGVPGRVGRLRGYGNAIVPEAAAVFIGAFMEAAP